MRLNGGYGRLINGCFIRDVAHEEGCAERRFISASRAAVTWPRRGPFATQNTMATFFENLLARLWNWLATRKHRHPINPGSLILGARIIDGRLTSRPVYVAQYKRTEHVVILGKTGIGKTSLQLKTAGQDIAADRGFFDCDFHGDKHPFLLAKLAAEEKRRNCDLSDRLIVIDPTDPEYSVGINILEPVDELQRFVQVAESERILRQRSQIDSLGSRTAELHSYTCQMLSEAGLTLLEAAPVLIDAQFRAAQLRRVSNPEVREYFETRYNRASERFQAVVRDALLNKLTPFTSDPHFRHMLGQQSTFSLREALDRKCWILLDLNKGRLGEHAATANSLVIAKLKNAIFARQSRSLFTLNLDELQNLVGFESGIDTLFSEARKFAVSICSANQFLDQHPSQIRAALLSIGTHIVFQLSPGDAETFAAAFGGGRSLAELLKNLPPRQFLLKSGHYPVIRGQVSTLERERTDYTDLLKRSRARWARKRTEVEREIRHRRSTLTAASKEALDDWE